MPIYPLPVFEADLKAQQEEDRKVYEALKAPTTIVVRFGSMKMVGEFPYKGDSKPGCGSKIVVQTHRGTELGEMLTSTCPNAGCSKSVTRKEMLQYIENSGGRDYPFTSGGRVLRIATAEDMNRQAAIEQSKHARRVDANEVVRRLNLPIKIAEVEPILGGERTTFYFTSEERVDFRDLVHELSLGQTSRVEMRQVGARDEARLTADYERCGQHCCCKQFLKVLKPISMKSAKTQKATLDPLKISGRCGRLMCCLRYEDQTYEELKKRLPRRKSRVGTPEGDGFVIDAQILTQLVLVRLDDERDVAIPVEDLTEPGLVRPPPPPPPPPPAPPPRERPVDRAPPPPRPARPPQPPARPEPTAPTETDFEDAAPDQSGEGERPGEARPGENRQSGGRRRRRRRRGDGSQRPPVQGEGGQPPQARPQPPAGQPPQGGPPPAGGGRRRRRRRRLGGPGGPGGQGGGGPSGGPPNQPPPA